MDKFSRKIKKARDREKCGRVKEMLKRYVIDLKTIDEIVEEIEKKRDRLDSLKSGMSSTDPVKGGGTSQEDKIIKILDDLRELEEGLNHLRSEINEIDNLIKALPDPKMAVIVYDVWIYRTETMRSLGTKYGLSNTAIWKKSDTALLNLYNKLYKDA